MGSLGKHQPSDLVQLLRRMAEEHNDATCQALHDMAARGAPILDVCHLAITHLAGEKASYLRRLILQSNFQLPRVILVEKGTFDKLDESRTVAGEKSDRPGQEQNRAGPTY